MPLSPLLFWIVSATLLLLALAVAPFDDRLLNLISSTAPDGSLWLTTLEYAGYVFAWPSYVVVGLVLAIDPVRRRLLVSYALTVVSFVVLTHGLKWVMGRARPALGLGPAAFTYFGDARRGYDSLPSGHAGAAGLLTCLIILYYPRFGWILVPFAVLASLCRVAVQKHFPSDVAIGAALGTALVAVCAQVLSRRSNRLHRDAANAESQQPGLALAQHVHQPD